MDLKSVSNNRLTLLRKLNRKKYRQNEHLFIVEGARAVEQIIDNGLIPVEGLFFDASQQLWDESDWPAKSGRNESFKVNTSDFLEITDTANPQGILALCQIPPESTVQNLAKERGVLIATDGIQDPGNMGTIIRTASWFGVNGILMGKGTVDLFHPKVVRSTAGATGTIPYLNADLETDLFLFEQEDWRVILLDDGPGAQDLRTLEKMDKSILIVGNEANGIRDNLFTGERLKGSIKSPTPTPHVESLNASVALSIALFALAN